MPFPGAIAHNCGSSDEGLSGAFESDGSWVSTRAGRDIHPVGNVLACLGHAS